MLPRIKYDESRRTLGKIGVTLGLSSAVCPLGALMMPESALADLAEPLRLFNPHSNERYDVQLFQGGSFNSASVLVCDWMMRDFRESRTVVCDRKIYVALYVVQRFHRVQSPLILNSGFRSPKTNAMLRTRSIEENGGVSWETPAVNSQHCQAKAVDFRVPGVEPRAIAAYVETLALGGVGNYPTFTHMDTASIRHWGPRP